MKSKHYGKKHIGDLFITGFSYNSWGVITSSHVFQHKHFQNNNKRLTC